jgi:chloramphenicol-sensitive protein RarD
MDSRDPVRDVQAMNDYLWRVSLSIGPGYENDQVKSDMKNLRYYTAAVTAFTIWGFFSFVLKPLSRYPSLDILFYRVFLSAAIMLPISTIFRKKAWNSAKNRYQSFTPEQKRGQVMQILGGGLFLTANWFFFIYVMNHISIKAASFAYLICPVLTTVLAYFILKERLNKWQWIAVSLSLLSCLLLSFSSLSDLFYSMIIALSYALYLVSQRKDYGIDRFLILSWQVVFSALLLLPFYPFYRGAVPRVLPFYEFIAVIAVFFTIVPLFLNLYALKGLRSSTVGILLYINPLFAFIIAILYYFEKLDMLQVAAYVIILISVIIFNLPPGKRKDRLMVG